MKSLVQDLSSTNRPIYGAASISVKNTLYIYGGFYHVSPWNKEALWKLSATGSLNQLPTDPYASPALIYSSLQSYQDRYLFAFGGHLDESISNTSQPAENLRYYQLDLETLKWKPLQKKDVSQTDISPLERFWHTTAVYDDKVYMLGGMNKTHGMNDFWMYDMAIDTWTRLPLFFKTGICGHTSIMTGDGKMVTLGGFECSTKNSSLMNDKALLPLDKAFIFDTNSNSWYEQILTGSVIPSARTFHNAVKTKNQNIAVWGGQDGKASPFQTYLPQQMALLDIKTWSWKIPPASSQQPFPRSHAIAGTVNGTRIVYGQGINDHTVFDNFYLYDLESDQWLSTLTDPSIRSGTRLEDWKIGLCIVGGVFILMFVLFFAYRFVRRNLLHFQMMRARLKKIVWNPRSGEPLWAESSRLAFRILSLIIFSVVATGLMIQVIKSPIIEQDHKERISNRSVIIPDIRFCFDGWLRNENPWMQCTTNTGESCNHLMMNMSDAIQFNVNYYGTSRPSCILFRASFNATPSFVNFYYTGSPTNTSVTHIELYHPRHNPNIPVYNITGQFDRWYSLDEEARFQSMEQMNLKTENTHTIARSVGFTQITYSVHERRTLPPNDLCSLFGLFGTPRYQQQFSVKSKVNQEQLGEETAVSAGTIRVSLSKPNVAVIEEQRAFTLIQGLGILGGFAGLFITLLVNLFGFRPRSPFGIVHRWFSPRTQTALLKGLKESMFLPTNQTQQQHNDPDDPIESSFYAVPIVQPVHERFLKTPVYHSKLNKKDSGIVGADIETEHQQQMKRMIRLENRLRIFDVLLKAYYIDDEVFQSLHDQRHDSQPI